MKINKKKKKIKALIYLLSMTVLGFLYAYIEHRYIRQGIVIAYLILAALFLRALWQIYGRKLMNRYHHIIDEFNKFIKKNSKKIITKIKQILKISDKPARIKGSDKRSIEFDFQGIQKIKKLLNIKTKLDLDDADINTEKIRLLYVKLILKSIKEGFDFKESLTPNEIYMTLENKACEPLIDCYQNVRYGKLHKISDETVNKFESILEE